MFKKNVEYIIYKYKFLWVREKKMGLSENKNSIKSSDLINENEFIKFIDESGKWKELLLDIIEKNSELKAENDRLKEISKAIPFIAHDVNNILSPVLNCIEIIEKQKLTKKDLNKNLSIMKLCTEDGLYITNKIKKIIKGCMNEDEKETFLIDDLIDDVIRIQECKLEKLALEKNKKITLVKEADSGVRVKGSAPLIRDIISNIIKNAIDSIENEGKISIATKKKDDKAVIKITDTGKGMTEETKNKIFEPFFTTKGEEGLGIGLSMAKKIIMCHHGNMRVISRINHGTSFIIELPECTKAEMKKSEKKSEKKAVSQNSVKFIGNILLIDDNQQVAKVISDLLKSVTDCNVISSDGNDVEEIIDKNPINIVLCDYSMPDRTGLEIAKVIKNRNVNIYFCLLTGFTGKFKKEKIENIDYVLNKPINTNQINQMFSDYSSKIKKS